MWKVGGTKIERTRARYIFLPSGHINLRKSDLLGKTRFEVTAAQSEVIGQKPEVLQKIRGVMKN